MKAHTASLLNALTLILLSGWGYLATDMKSLTALIPAVAGVALLGCYPGVKSENKVIAHVAVTITLLIFIALLQPFFGAIGDGDTWGMVRPLIMLVTTAIAMVFFIKSFRDARRAREQG